MLKQCVATAGLAMLLALGVSAQTNPTGTLTGIVTDPSGAAIPGAKIVVTETATHRIFNIQSDATGRFSLANLSPDSYEVVVTHPGFQSGDFKAVAISVGQTYTLAAKLKVGEATQTVEVTAGQQVLETVATAVAGQVTGSQITQIPIASRNSQDLAIIMPALQTTTTPRNSQIDGLPNGAVNLTFDGINSQDNLLKSSAGSSFFSTEQPRIDDVEEFSMTSAANDASQSGEGAVQVAFVSKKGTNQWHGGGWEYLRNDDLNANNYFNNIAGLPRQRIRLNEFGYKIGGPILKNKLFFFTDLDWWENPQAQARTRTILTPSAAQGQFTYTPTAAPGSNSPNAWTDCNGAGINAGQAAGTCTADLMKMMGPQGLNTGLTSTVDSVEANIMSLVSKAQAAPGVTVGAQTNSNTIPLNFNANAASHRKYPDLRLDYNINAKNSLEYDYHYAHYFDGPDVLNNADATFPVAPFNANQGAQISNRNLMAFAWRHQISDTINNELRVGGQSAPLWFGQGENMGIYPALKVTTAQGVTSNILMRPGVPSLMSNNPYLNFAPGGRNTSLGQLNETLNWLHGNHSMSMGATFTRVLLKDNNSGEQVAAVGLGMNSNDPAFGFFGSSNLPGISSSDNSTAQNLYAVLAGRVTSFNQTINVNPNTRNWQSNYNLFDQVKQYEMGYFFSDSWHMSPTLTFNYGLRWEYEGTPTDELNEYYLPVGGASGVFGISGVNGLFQPGSSAGAVTSYVNDKGQTFYKAAKNSWAPSVGFAWTPAGSGGLLHGLLGNTGDSVFRAGYSIAYDREGLSNFTNLAPTNPGVTNNAFRNASNVDNTSGQFQAGSIQLQNATINNAAQEETVPFGSPLAVNSSFGDQVNAYDPGLAQPMIQSWSVGFQRQLNRDTALEVRYVGNHGTREWVTINENEVNVFENGFLKEFTNALNNLNICAANQAACAAAAGSSSKTFASFANNGLKGQVAVPILTAAFTDSISHKLNTSSFSNGTFISDLQNGLVGSFANSLAPSSSNLANWQNMTALGYPSNFFKVNPDTTGGAFLLNDLNQSTYNGLQVELRRRMAKGLQFNANYTYSHAFGTGSLITLRNYGANKAPASSDLRHVFKIQSQYQLPFGTGHQFKTGWSLLDNAIGGWEWDTVNRWQSGTRFALTGGAGGTFNQADGGVQYTGLYTTGQVASLLSVSQQTNSSGKGAVFYAPNALLGGNQQKANTAIWAPCSTAGFECEHPYLYGPSFFKADWSLQKNTKLTERLGLTLRADVLDAFNNINFQTPASGNLSSTSFMRITSAYSDFTSTQDPGGRVIQLVARINF